VFGLALVALTSDWRVLVVDNLGNIGMHGMYLTCSATKMFRLMFVVPPPPTYAHINTTGRHLAMNGGSSTRLVRVMSSGIGERTKVLSMAVLQPNFTTSGKVCVLLVYHLSHASFSIVFSTLNLCCSVGGYISDQ
jgi:hypothetical protein